MKAGCVVAGEVAVEICREGLGGLYCFKTGALAHLSLGFFVTNIDPDRPNEEGLLGVGCNFC